MDETESILDVTDKQRTQTNNQELFESPNLSSNSSSSTLTGDENYVIQTKICPRLSRELNLQEIIYDEIGSYEPPKEYGLNNSNVIIPCYYRIHEKPEKITRIYYFEIIKDDIRNFRKLNKYQLEYIKDLSHEYKNILLEIFNDCVESISDLVLN